MVQELPFSSGDYAPVQSFPNYVVPSKWYDIEHQGSIGSCNGQASSGCLEVSYYYIRGEEIHFSRMFAYLQSQKFDGITSDRGSTISGGAKTVTEVGLPLESTFPYPSSYVRRIPQAAYDEAGEYKAKQAVWLKTYDDIINFLDSGLGAINIGVRWGRGGHAVCITETIPGGGVKVANSWGTNWGDDGWFTWSASQLKQKMRESYTRAVGITDMVDLVPRTVDWESEGGGFGG
jgi:C1A family cysteine protease